MQLTFIVAALTTLTIPGLAIALALRIKSQLILTSIAFSYSLFIFVYASLSLLNHLSNHLLSTYLVILTLSLFFIIIHMIKNRTLLLITENTVAVVSIALFVFIYLHFAGVYTEVPSDLYSHLERYQFVSNRLSEGSNISRYYRFTFLLQNHVWYYFLSILATVSPLTSAELIESTAYVTNLLFIISVYFFSKTIFANQRNVVLVCIACCVFTVLHLGINVFSFVRYYAFGPTNIGFCLYFAAISQLIKATKEDRNSDFLISMTAFALFTLAAFFNHMQEALFILVISSIMIGIHRLLLVTDKTTLDHARNYHERFWSICLLGIILCSIGSYLYAHIYMIRGPNVHWRLWEFGQGIGIFPDITILNLKFQFIRVFTLWGCLVYCLFLINIRRYKQNIFIIAGMVSPFFTILNPFFVDLFLRIDNSTTIWRLIWIVPIHFVAADLFIHYFRKVNDLYKLKKIYPLVVLVFLIGLLMPIKNTWQKVHYSRLTTLLPTKLENSHYYYQDVIEFLDTIEDKKPVLTDPITGYIISAMTRHINYRYKFFPLPSFKHFTFQEYNETTLSKYKGWLLIINKRKQSLSEVGRLSGHWAAKELLQIENYYPAQLINHVENNPQLFNKVWSNNDVSIYQLQ